MDLKWIDRRSELYKKIGYFCLLQYSNVLDALIRH